MVTTGEVGRIWTPLWFIAAAVVSSIAQVAISVVVPGSPSLAFLWVLAILLTYWWRSWRDVETRNGIVPPPPYNQGEERRHEALFAVLGSLVLLSASLGVGVAMQGAAATWNPSLVAALAVAIVVFVASAGVAAGLGGRIATTYRKADRAWGLERASLPTPSPTEDGTALAGRDD